MPCRRFKCLPYGTNLNELPLINHRQLDRRSEFTSSLIENRNKEKNDGRLTFLFTQSPLGSDWVPQRRALIQPWPPPCTRRVCWWIPILCPCLMSPDIDASTLTEMCHWPATSRHVINELLTRDHAFYNSWPTSGLVCYPDGCSRFPECDPP